MANANVSARLSTLRSPVYPHAAREETAGVLQPFGPFVALTFPVERRAPLLLNHSALHRRHHHLRRHHHQQQQQHRSCGNGGARERKWGCHSCCSISSSRRSSSRRSSRRRSSRRRSNMKCATPIRTTVPEKRLDGALLPPPPPPPPTHMPQENTPARTVNVRWGGQDTCTKPSAASTKVGPRVRGNRRGGSAASWRTLCSGAGGFRTGRPPSRGRAAVESNPCCCRHRPSHEGAPSASNLL
jgi:hypothetical protein